MEPGKSSSGNSQFVFGLLVVVVGVVFLLDNLDIVEAREVFRYWPVIPIIIGVFKLTNAMSTVGRIVGLFFIVVGVLLLLDKMSIVHFHFWDWWPMILILIGGSMLLNSTRWRNTASGGGAVDEAADIESIVNLFAFMGGYKRASRSQDFRGGEITAIMGGCEIDLRQASMKSGPAVINIFAFWGGIAIKVPQDWNVTLQATPILGGIEDKTHAPQPGSEKRLIIRGQATMGGAEISN